MDERITEELLAELLASPSIEGFLDDNVTNEVTLSEYLQELLDKKGLKRAEVIRKANLNATFGYQVFTGARGAGRDTILQLAFAMELTLRAAGNGRGVVPFRRGDHLLISSPYDG